MVHTVSLFHLYTCILSDGKKAVDNSTIKGECDSLTLTFYCITFRIWRVEFSFHLKSLFSKIPDKIANPHVFIVPRAPEELSKMTENARIMKICLF